MSSAPARAVMSALSAKDGKARFVGGAVRNALLGEPVADVDIATRFTPDEVIRRLRAAGLRAVETGIEHGTITAIADGQPFEVTSLRRDVETFGRRAVVAFTADWAEDAKRRDFTINALYAGEDGTLFDYFTGLDDLVARHVRFIGDPHQRIHEDYLRILRFFRFYARYGRGEPDHEGMTACVAEKHGLRLLSAERVQKELLLLLQTRRAAPVLRIMQDRGILPEIVPVELHLPRLERLIAIEEALGMAPDPLLRLAALLPDSAAAARSVAQSLRLSNEARGRIVAAAEKEDRIRPSASDSFVRAQIYRLGKPRFADQLLLRWAEAAGPEDASWRALFERAHDWRPPQLPVDGQDVMALGVSEGPEIGVHLRALEQWWIDQDFSATRPALLEHLKTQILSPCGRGSAAPACGGQAGAGGAGEGEI